MFRTEKGDVANYPTKFQVVPTPKSNIVKQVKQAPKPKYDSLLDMVWDQHEKNAKESEYENESKVAKEELETKEVKTYLQQYMEPLEWLDLQAQADIMRDIHEILPDEHTAQEEKERATKEAKMKLQVLKTDDMLLNNDYPDSS